ncbi:MAG: type II secretion system protein GspJ [Deltaproteobacteria bacterium]
MRNPRGHAGVTLIEIMVASAILAMIGTMIYGAFDHTGRLRTRLSARQERDHVGRIAVNKIQADLRMAYLSAHVHPTQQYVAQLTAFVGLDQSPGDRLDFTSFSHRRLLRNVHEGDSCEVGYRLDQRRGASTYDLLRRESARIDTEPTRGGTLDVLATDVLSLNFRYYDPTNDGWRDTWDTTQPAGQTNRLPSRVRVTLGLRDSDGRERTYMSEVAPMIADVLRFGLPIDYH